MKSRNAALNELALLLQLCKTGCRCSPGCRTAWCSAQPEKGYRGGAGGRPSPARRLSLAAARRGADGAAHVQVGGLRLGLCLGFVGGLRGEHGLTRLLLALL